jgi:type I restriction enzyme R subunit
MVQGFSEDALVERPAVALFRDMGWEVVNCYHETFGPAVPVVVETCHGMSLPKPHGMSLQQKNPTGRETMAEVVLVPRLQAAIRKLNPDLPDEALGLAVEELTRDRSTMSPVAANREVYRLLKNGVKVTFRGSDQGEERVEMVRVLDWDSPRNNDFFLAFQLWIAGEMYTRRADLVGFVNGIPLVLIELKATHKRLENAYEDNLRDYKDTIPHVFWYNAFILLSNGSESKIGSLSAEWEHFNEWKKITSEGEQGIVSLATILRGTCEPERLLDLVENFVLYSEEKKGPIKLVSKNHQFLGVNNVLRVFHEIKKNQGRLGVFWHTQGSGKSYSMIFFAQKVLRKLPGNWTFVVVTDRKDLDDQIYKNFVRAGAVTEPEAQAESSENLRQLLREDHRYVFTLIQKFRSEKGEGHPMLSDRSDIIVIVDEAHRTQYDAFALNMRQALPNAAFIAFTGTPLLAGEEKTRRVFGDYVSIYNFKQSADDHATVPLFYENRIPELQLTNEQLNEDLERLLDEALVDQEQENRVEREFAREYHLITREDRLGKIAEDIVTHFMGRGYLGKAMVVSVDKATAVRMYDKVKRHWERHLGDLRRKLALGPKDDIEGLKEKIRYMQETDMAVVVSQSQNEIQELRRKDLDIAPHRRRIVNEELDEKFKDPEDPFRIVFVCAMWMTGFDVPCCSTIYLDKPMRNHTLMQTIARANRVFKEKTNGLIVDYVGVFRNLQKALAIYGSGSGGGIKEGESPVQDKSVLIVELRKAIGEATAFCLERGVEPGLILGSEGLQRVKFMDEAVDAILENEDTKRRFLFLAGSVARLYKAILPDPQAGGFKQLAALFDVLAAKIHSLSQIVKIKKVNGAINKLLDESVAARKYVIRAVADRDRYIDLSKIDFEALAKEFEKGRKRTEAEILKNAINEKLTALIRRNKTRLSFQEKFQQLIDEYNTGSQNVDEFFKQLMAFAKSLNEEEKRGIKESLTEEELAIFDLLTKPEIELASKEVHKVKKVAHDLLESLKREKLVLDWRKRQQSRAAVLITIKDHLYQLPKAFSGEIYVQKCAAVYQHVFESYFGEGQSVYGLSA